MGGWRNAVQEAAASKPLFLTIYTTIIVGIVATSFYVFSAIYSPSASTSTQSISTSWLSSPPLSQNGGSNFSNNISQPTDKASQPGSNQLKTIWQAPPSNSKMPPLESFKLTKELVGERAKDNVIIVTFGNFAFMDFILTWVKHLTDLDVSNLLVGAMDTKLLEALYWEGVPVFDMGSHMSTIDVGWGSPTFHKMGREKVLLINAILPFGYELLMCDTDMVWLKDPLPYLAQYPDADILTSSDQVVPTVVDDRLADWKQADDKIWDQNGFNELARKQTGPAVDDDSGLFYAFDGTLKLGILPESIFCSGHTYFVQAMYEQLRLEPYALHTTFQYGGTEGKRHRLREAMVFYDPPEYYDAPGGFLSFKPSIPKSLLLDGEHNLESHFSLINYQMKQIRSALAIASLLNRTLVMPPLWCRLDRLWFSHPGVLEGSMTRQPFLCPLDHIFEVNVMLKDLPEEEFGPANNIREYSFLNNPLLPQQVKESWLDVQLCQEGTEDCHASSNTSRPGLLRFPKNSTEEMVWLILHMLISKQYSLHSRMSKSSNSLQCKTREEKFRNRMKRYVGIWCCVENHTPGHIYYDMYWDEKSGWKPAPPQTPEEDHPPF
ncbi:hypothetical protein GOBAR_DD04797 [Gossypium barbadense]|nr:hypothetical protein GOBAR_DD04797 [Gossypium barbadense]